MARLTAGGILGTRKQPDKCFYDLVWIVIVQVTVLADKSLSAISGSDFDSIFSCLNDVFAAGLLAWIGLTSMKIGGKLHEKLVI